MRVGTKQHSNLTLVQTIDFKVDIAIDGEPLSQEEIEGLLKARHGLTLLRGKWVEVDADKLQKALDQWRSLADDRAGWNRFPRRDADVSWNASPRSIDR